MKRNRIKTITRHGNNKTNPSGTETDELRFSRIRRRKNANRGIAGPFSCNESSRGGKLGVGGRRFLMRWMNPMRAERQQRGRSRRGIEKGENGIFEVQGRTTTSHDDRIPQGRPCTIGSGRRLMSRVGRSENSAVVLIRIDRRERRVTSGWRIASCLSPDFLFPSTKRRPNAGPDTTGVSAKESTGTWGRS
jgi:hypothetical protein